MKLNVITGLPRSGSTLLCNILNQNPAFHATSTSTLPQYVGTCINIWSGSFEIKGDLARDREATEKRLQNALLGFCLSWHAEHSDKSAVFDKSRGWAHNLLALRQVFPESKVLVTVRDLRNVFASVEKQHRKFPLLDSANGSIEKTIYSRADNMFSPKGLIGGPIEGVQDIMRRKLDVLFIKFEQFCKFPEQVMREVYQYLGEEYYNHDYTNVVSTATELDALYNYKVPHEGSGEVKPTDPDEWTKFMSQELGDTIMNRFPLYNNFFGYSLPQQRITGNFAATPTAQPQPQQPSQPQPTNYPSQISNLYPPQEGATGPNNPTL